MFRPELFGASVLFTVVAVSAAAAVTIYQAARLTPLEALHYTGVREAKTGKERLKRQAHWRYKKRVLIPYRIWKSSRWQVFCMAWKNLFRYKKRCFLTIVALFLGVVTALGAVVLTKGTDMTHAIEKGADFTISGNMLGQLTEEMIAQSDPKGGILMTTQRDEFTPITQETKERLLSVQGVQKENTVLVKGAYIYLDGLAVIECVGMSGGQIKWMLAAVAVVCVSVPLVMYGQMEKRSVTRRTVEE